MHGHVQETAINVGFACSLLRTDMAQHIVTASTREVNLPTTSFSPVLALLHISTSHID